MSPENDDRIDAWHRVWNALREHNPDFMSKAPTGIESAIAEIYRLQRQPGGRSLRDWFAGQALTGLCANPKTISDTGGFNLVNFATAYEMADAMLAERQKGGAA